MEIAELLPCEACHSMVVTGYHPARIHSECLFMWLVKTFGRNPEDYKKKLKLIARSLRKHLKEEPGYFFDPCHVSAN